MATNKNEMFDPSKHKGSQQAQGSGDLPAGDYLLAMKWFERRTAKTGGAYLRCKYAVVYGPRAGAEFWSNLSIDVSKEGAAGRLSVYCSAVGVDKPFSLSDDSALRRVFVGRPFKAKVKVRVDGGYTNHDIERYVLSVSDSERQIMNNWVLDQQEAEAMGERRGARSAQPGNGDEGGWSDDDDGDGIPF